MDRFQRRPAHGAIVTALSYLTVNDMAKRLGVSAQMVRKRAKLRNVGLRPAPRVLLFTEADVAKMQPALHPGGRE